MATPLRLQGPPDAQDRDDDALPPTVSVDSAGVPSAGSAHDRRSGLRLVSSPRAPRHPPTLGPILCTPDAALFDAVVAATTESIALRRVVHEDGLRDALIDGRRASLLVDGLVKAQWNPHRLLRLARQSEARPAVWLLVPRLDAQAAAMAQAAGAQAMPRKPRVIADVLDPEAARRSSLAHASAGLAAVDTAYRDCTGPVAEHAITLVRTALAQGRLEPTLRAYATALAAGIRLPSLRERFHASVQVHLDRPGG